MKGLSHSTQKKRVVTSGGVAVEVLDISILGNYSLDIFTARGISLVFELIFLVLAVT